MTKSRQPAPDLQDTQKVGYSLLHRPERALIDWAVPRMPAAIRSHHLTMLTLVWSLGIGIFGYLAQSNLLWLHGISFLIFMQWLTDSLDGSVGRYQNEGLIKWGYFMDHFLDLIFAGSVVIAYTFIAPDSLNILLFILLLCTSGFMAVSFLTYGVTSQLRVTYFFIGPTEVRIGYIALNTFVYFAGTAVFWWGVPLIVIGNVASLVLLVARTSRMLWRMDKKHLSETRKR